MLSLHISLGITFIFCIIFSIPFLEHSVSLHLFRSLIIFFLSAFCTFQHTCIGYVFIRFIINHFIKKLFGGSGGKKSACNTGDLGLIPGSVRSPGEGLGNLLQYSCLENSVGRAWWAVPWGLKESYVTEWWTLHFSHFKNCCKWYYIFKLCCLHVYF